MTDLLDRIAILDGTPTLRSGGIPLVEIESRLEQGEPLASIADTLGVEPLDMIAALAALGLGLEGSEGPTLTQRSPAHPRWKAALSEPALAELFPSSNRPERLALAAGLLLIHDFWDASHTAAQEADDLGEREFSAYWHGIAHRREPDPGNATYWFRRVGTHPVYERLGTLAEELIRRNANPTPDADRIVRGGVWDPFAFIEFCRKIRRADPAESLARRLQRLEMAVLLDPTAARAAHGRG